MQAASTEPFDRVQHAVEEYLQSSMPYWQEQPCRATEWASVPYMQRHVAHVQYAYNSSLDVLFQIF